jgi:hypothetical protein
MQSKQLRYTNASFALTMGKTLHHISMPDNVMLVTRYCVLHIRIWHKLDEMMPQ